MPDSCRHPRDRVALAQQWAGPRLVASYPRCRDCGARVERLYTTVDAAAALDVPEKTISDWKVQGRVRPAEVITGRGRGGLVPLYDLEDLRPLAEAYHARERTTRR